MTNRKASGSSPSSICRRRFLASGAAVASAAFLAGCSGGSSNDTSGGLTINYWNRFHNNSARASDAIKQAISTFEEETDATVNVRYASGEPGQKWVTLMREGERPHILDQVSGQVGKFVALDIAKPFQEYRNLFSDELQKETAWLMDPLGRQAYSGYDGQPYEFKFSAESPRLFLARRDHLEAAGLSPQDDFPPTNFKECIDLARTLQEEGPADFGFQIYGSDGDVTDTATEDWPIAHGGNAGKLLNKDWSDTQIDNQSFKQTYENFVSILTEHKLTSPGTISMSDEDATQLLVQGRASMTQIPTATYADLLANSEQMIMDGKFVFGEAWKGPSGARGMTGGNGVVFTKPPDGANAEDWGKAQKAAADMLENYVYFAKDFQKNMFRTVGGGPIRESIDAKAVMEAAEDPTGYEQSNIIKSRFKCINDQDGYYIQSAAPMFGPIQGSIMPGYIQQSMQGKLSPSEALNQAANEARNQFFQG